MARPTVNLSSSVEATTELNYSVTRLVFKLNFKSLNLKLGPFISEALVDQSDL